MKMKILSPAGDFDSLRMAVFNGADEVYLGVRNFNARNIEGFTLETLKEAIDFAHLFDVRVFLTVNILFSDDEIQSAVDLIVDAYNLGVDAFIIQDLGLASIIHDFYPMIELHASTQMGIHNLEGVQEIEKLGFKRVVLSRETPLDEIKRIRDNSDIEIEYFAHGALCISFSGNCYLSSYLFDASGNRGKCKQLCRLPYTLVCDDKKIKDGYLLSAKDFCMLDRLEDLEKVGVTSLKIEGRARRPYYVAIATRTYRKALDNLSIDREELSLAFNRGYTEGYFNGNGNIISNLQNHIGNKIGTVIDFHKGKNFNEIFINSNREITPKSTLKFIKENVEENVVSAYDVKKKDDVYKITTTQEIVVGSDVHLLTDADREIEVLNEKARKKINIKIIAKINAPITAEIILNNEKIIVAGDICSESKTSPLTLDELKLNFSKSEYFDIDIDAKLDNVFLPKKLLNEFRRNVLDRIFNELTKINHKKLEKIVISKLANENKLEDYQIVNDIDIKLIKKHIIYSPEIYDIENIKELKSICEKDDKIFILNTPNFALKADIETLRNIITQTQIPIMVNNLYALSFNSPKFIGGGMNVYNGYTAKFLGYPYLVAERSEFKMPYMTIRSCPMKEHLGANCAICPYNNNYKYRMQSGKELSLRRVKMSTCTFYLTD